MIGIMISRNIAHIIVHISKEHFVISVWILWDNVVAPFLFRSVFPYHPILVARYYGVSPQVIKHGWLENPRAEWRFLARKITDFYSPFSSTPCWMNREGSSTHCIPSCGGHEVIPTKLARTARTPKK